MSASVPRFCIASKPENLCCGCIWTMLQHFSSCRKIVRLYNEIVELMLAASYRGTEIAAFRLSTLCQSCTYPSVISLPFGISAPIICLYSQPFPVFGVSPLANSAKISVKPCAGLSVKGRRDSDPPWSQSAALISFYPLLSLGSNTPWT